MIIKTNAVENRKVLVKTLSEMLNEKPRYCGAPSFAYEFGIGRLDREAILHLAPSLKEQAADQLASLLAERGFSCTIAEEEPGFEIAEAPIEEDEDEVCKNNSITILDERLTPETVAKLSQVIAGKATLMRKALGAEILDIDIVPGGCRFPWFPEELSSDEQRAYELLLNMMIAFAAERTRITAVDKPVPNDKYAFRCFLLRLGMIGKEYKAERAVLLRNLEGNSAFRCGFNPHRREKEPELAEPA